MIIGNYKKINYSDKILDLDIFYQRNNKIGNTINIISNFCSNFITVDFVNNASFYNSISVIINELVENAVKYSYKDSGNKINIKLFTKDFDEVIVEVKNIVSKEYLDKLKKIGRTLSSSKEDFGDFLINMKCNNHQSGIGLMMIINYYNVKLSFNLNKCLYKDLKSKNLYTVIVQGKFLLGELSK